MDTVMPALACATVVSSVCLGIAIAVNHLVAFGGADD